MASWDIRGEIECFFEYTSFSSVSLQHQCPKTCENPPPNPPDHVQIEQNRSNLLPKDQPMIWWSLKFQKICTTFIIHCQPDARFCCKKPYLYLPHTTKSAPEVESRQRLLSKTQRWPGFLPRKLCRRTKKTAAFGWSVGCVILGECVFTRVKSPKKKDNKKKTMMLF